jgi:peptide/nickel transport system substrate-binding protein
MPTSLPYWINPSIKAYDFNLNESARILDAAGYKVGSDGVRASPSGVKLSYSIVVPSNYAFLYRAAQIVADWWGQIGVRATPSMVDAATISSLEHNWKFDTAMWTWSAGYTVDPDWFVSYLVSSQARPAPNTGSSDSGFMNATFDALYQQQIQQVDPTKRQQIIWQMQQIVHDQIPYVTLFTPLAVQAFRSDRFTGVPNSNLPPLGQFYSNTLFLSLTPLAKAPVTATTTANTSASGATGMIVIIAIVVVLVVGLGYVVVRRRSASRK